MNMLPLSQLRLHYIKNYNLNPGPSQPRDFLFDGRDSVVFIRRGSRRICVFGVTVTRTGMFLDYKKELNILDWGRE